MTELATKAARLSVRATGGRGVAERAMWLLFALAALYYPFSGSPFTTDIGFRICALVMLAVSWNMMAGAGLISLGHSAFWGRGKLGVEIEPVGAACEIR